jgi:hypothetical protein
MLLLASITSMYPNNNKAMAMAVHLTQQKQQDGGRTHETINFCENIVYVQYQQSARITRLLRAYCIHAMLTDNVNNTELQIAIVCIV